MRVLVALFFLTAGITLAAPPANACHPVLSSWERPIGDYYVVPDVGVSDCPHEVTFCVQVWKETNGEPGLQRVGWTPDHAVLVVCPLP